MVIYEQLVNVAFQLVVDDKIRANHGERSSKDCIGFRFPFYRLMRPFIYINQTTRTPHPKSIDLGWSCSDFRHRRQT